MQNANDMKTQEFKEFILTRIEEGFTVQKSGNRYFFDKGKIKLETLPNYDGEEALHIGKVDTHSSKGKWEVRPILLSEDSFQRIIK